MRGVAFVVLVASAACAQPVVTPAISDWLGQGRELRSAFEKLIEGVRPSIVEVLSTGAESEARTVLGTVVGPDLLVTKSSEVSADPKVVLPDGREVAASVVKRDEVWDIVALRVPGEVLEAITFIERDLVPGTVLVNPGRRVRPLEISVVSWAPREIAKDPGQPLLGVRVRDIKDKDGERQPGVEVVAVQKQTPADDVGLQKEDILVSLDGEPIKDQADFFGRIMDKKPKDVVKLRARRGDKTLDLEATLAKRPEGGPRHAAEVNLRLSKRRDAFPRAVRHDATLSYARQGGPVLDLEGNVVGINIARSGRTQCLLLLSFDVKAFLK